MPEVAAGALMLTVLSTVPSGAISTPTQFDMALPLAVLHANATIRKLLPSEVTAGTGCELPWQPAVTSVESRSALGPMPCD